MNSIKPSTCTEAEQKARAGASQMKTEALKKAIALAWDSQPNIWKLQTIHTTGYAYDKREAEELARLKWDDFPEHVRNLISQAIIRGIQFGRTWTGILLAANEQLIVKRHKQMVANHV